MTASSRRDQRPQVQAFPATVERAFVLSLPGGCDLHDGIIEACLGAGVRDAVLVEGHATLDRVSLHQVTSTAFPIVEHYRTLEGPYELVSVEGLLVDGELHAHVTVASRDHVVGGHLHQGSQVLYLAEIVVLALRLDHALTRRHEPGTDLWLLQPRDGSPDEKAEEAAR